MHAPPPFQVTISRFGVWRVACAALMVTSWLVTALWVTVAAAAAHPAWLALSVLLLLGTSVALLLHMWRLTPVSLRWDGQLWHLGLAATRGQEPRSGRLAVALDLGDWMLLRFVVDGARHGTWWPVQRRGHELAWHGLRATVYCARPVAQPTAAPF